MHAITDKQKTFHTFKTGSLTLNNLLSPHLGIMPLSLNLNRSNAAPSVTPCLDGKELQLDSKIVHAGLLAISVKGYDAGDRREEIGMKHRNSFWSVHRPELSKLNWASNCTTRSVEEYLKIQFGNQISDREFEESDVPPADFNTLTVIHSDSKQNSYSDEKYSVISKPKTTQFSDDDVAPYSIVRKSRAEFCVTIGHPGKPLMSDTSEDFNLKNVQMKDVTENLFCMTDTEKNISFGSNDGKVETSFRLEPKVPTEINKNENFTAVSQLYNERDENKTFGKEQNDKRLKSASREILFAMMDDKTQAN